MVTPSQDRDWCCWPQKRRRMDEERLHALEVLKKKMPGMMGKADFEIDKISLGECRGGGGDW